MSFKPSWSDKGATLSDKSARNEFGITQDFIIDGIRSGSLQFRENHIHGNPYFRLFRHEVEALVVEKYGSDYLENKKIQNELKAVNSELRKIKSRQKSLEKKKAALEAMLKE
jgi:hypothetical protein